MELVVTSPVPLMMSSGLCQARSVQQMELTLSKLEAYVQKKQDVPRWWVKDQTINSKCPRGIDCPDFRYQNEQPYSRQVSLLTSLGKVVDLTKVAIGFETLGI